MVKITVSAQILSENLGDGWVNNNDAAQALADYTEKIWLADLSGVIAAGNDVEICIDVQRSTGGSGREVSVDVDLSATDEASLDAAFDLMKQVKNTLTDEGVIWNSFCSSDEATPYFEAE